MLHKKKYHHPLILASLVPLLCCTGCVQEFETEKVDIKTNGIGVIRKEENSIQGSWYWYANPNSTIENIKVTVSDPKEPENTDTHYWYSDTNSDSHESITDDLDVNKICISGTLGDKSKLYEDGKGRYIGIGFDLCTTDADGDPKFFPHTVGTCPMDDKNELFKKFLGISFQLEFPQKIKKATRFIVQFKERGKDLDEYQPECAIWNKNESTTCGTVKNLENTGEEDNERLKVEVWQGDATRPDNNSDTDSEKKLEDPNLWALQAIHFQISSDEKGGGEMNFNFCLSDIKLVKERSSLSTNIFKPPYIGDVDTAGDKFEGTACLEDTELSNPWVPASLENDTDNCENNSDSDYDNMEEFWIMKEEVSAWQFYKWYKEVNNYLKKNRWEQLRLREWDSCTVYRYDLLKKAEEKGKELGTNDLSDMAAWGNKSANCITLEDAKRFCKWLGGNLPDKLHWEYAATGGCKKRESNFTWDEKLRDPDCGNSVIYHRYGPGCGIKNPPAEGCSDNALGGRTSTGICDMIGNLWEWVDEKCIDTNEIDCKSKVGEYYFIKGGAYDTPSYSTSSNLTIEGATSVEHRVEPHNPNRLGFRCIINEDTYNRCYQ